MSEYVITLLAAAAVTYILTPVVRRFAVAVGAMHAARERDVHEMPTPLLGGFAIYGGLAAALLLASRLSGLRSAFTETNMAKGLLLAGGLVVIMGFVDDRWGMGALSKLAGQVAAGVILVWSGAEIPWVPAPGGVTLILTSDQQVAVTILVVVVTMNAVNFIDGLDGLAAGIVGIGAIAFFAYYFTLVHRLGLLDQTEPALVSALLAGVCLGFLPHNFYPARIFMGDTGSMLIGLMLAYAPISSMALLDPASLTDTAAYAAGTVNRYGAIIPLLVPAAILLIPYADLLMAVVRRTRAGKSVFAPDKQHLQHRLLAIGHSHRTSVLIMYLWAALFAGTVIWLSIVRTPLFVLAIVTVAAILGLLLVTMPRLRPWSRVPVGDGSADGPGLRPARAAAAGVSPAAAVAAAAAPARAGGAGHDRRADLAAAPAEAAATRRATAAPSPQRPGWRAAGQAESRERDQAGWPQAARPGNAAAGNGAGGKRAAADSGAAAAPEETGGLPVNRAATPDGRSWTPAEAVPPWEDGAAPHGGAGQPVPPWEDRAAPHGGAGQPVPPWEDRAAPHGGAGQPVPPWEDGAAPLPGSVGSARSTGATRGVPPWEGESAMPLSRPGRSGPLWGGAGAGAGETGRRSAPPWEGTRAAPPWEGTRAAPPWEGTRAAPPWEGTRAAPPWDAGRAVPPWAADRAVPPWETARAADPEATGPIPVPPWAGAPGQVPDPADGPANGPGAPPWPPASPPRPPAAPPRP